MVATSIFLALRNWMRRRHLHKSWKWRKNKYFRSNGLKNWIFSTKIRDKDNNIKYLDLVRASSVKIVRHVKIKGDANPFDSEYIEYFEKRAKYKQNINVRPTKNVLIKDNMVAGSSNIGF
jgi:RNA-directed DNA polymerase